MSGEICFVLATSFRNFGEKICCLGEIRLFAVRLQLLLSEKPSYMWSLIVESGAKVVRRAVPRWWYYKHLSCSLICVSQWAFSVAFVFGERDLCRYSSKWTHRQQNVHERLRDHSMPHQLCSLVDERCADQRGNPAFPLSRCSPKQEDTYAERAHGGCMLGSQFCVFVSGQACSIRNFVLCLSPPVSAGNTNRAARTYRIPAC